MNNKKFPSLTGTILVVTGLSLNYTAQAQQIAVDEGCYYATVDGIEGQIDFDNEGNLAIWDNQGNFLAWAPDHCYDVAAQQEQQQGQQPDVSSGVKSGDTVPVCGTPGLQPGVQCQQAPETLNLGSSQPAQPQPQATQQPTGNTAAEYVAAHNKWRREVGVPDISWSDQLAQSSQGWANHLQSQGCQTFHDRGDFGENLADAWSNPGPVTDSITMTVDGWGSEKRFYDYNSNTCSNPNTQEGCGHYTQMVWRNTQQVGCASASCSGNDGSETKLWVCRYSPAGNYEGERPY